MKAKLIQIIIPISKSTSVKVKVSTDSLGLDLVITGLVTKYNLGYDSAPTLAKLIDAQIEMYKAQQQWKKFTKKRLDSAPVEQAPSKHYTFNFN